MSELQNELGQPIGASLADWKQPMTPPRTPMQGRFCRVVPLEPIAHGDKLYDGFCEDTEGGDWTYLPYGPFHSRDEFLAWLGRECTHQDPMFFAIIDSVTDSPLGLASYLRIEPSIGVIEVGHLHYSPRLQSTPAATEAMFLMMSRVFDELGYRRYEWKCDSLNERSRRSALRLGFTFEGIFRQATVYKGRNRDTAWYSIIDAEWSSLRHAYQQWLSPKNLSNAGVQKQPLSAFVERATLYK